MKETNKFFYKIFFLIFFVFTAQAESKVLSIGSPDAKVTIKVFSSLTCPHCANFHENIYESLKPGGYAVHIFPTLYTIPFIINKYFSSYSNKLTPALLTPIVRASISQRCSISSSKNLSS